LFLDCFCLGNSIEKGAGKKQKQIQFNFLKIFSFFALSEKVIG